MHTFINKINLLLRFWFINSIAKIKKTDAIIASVLLVIF
jgi:hypothetical protein